MAGGHQHARQHGDRPRAALDTALDPFAQDRASELEETALDDPLRIIGPEALDELEEFVRRFRVTAAVPDQ
jgi:hypothetical protein